MSAPGPAAAEADEKDAPPEPPREVSAKARLDPKALLEKREGGYFTGLPLLNYDTNTGVGFGARVYYYFNGERADPRFEYTPYLQRLYAQAFFSTLGQQYHTIDYDAPYLGGRPLRLRAAAIFERNTYMPYFGRGAETLSPLGYPGSPGTFLSLTEFEDTAARIGPDGTTFARYDRYRFTRPVVRGSLEHDLFGGWVRILGGASVSYGAVHDYTGERVSGIDPMGNSADGIEAPTKLHDDCARGQVFGCDGGWNNFLKVGLAFDTRDFEPDPTSGVFAELTGEISSKIFGSSWAYQRATGSVRGFLPILRAPMRLIGAGRAVYSVQTGDVPFFEMNTLAFTDGDMAGLGGLRTLRGFAQDRFVGKVAAVVNFELRWTVFEIAGKDNRFAFMLVPFLDLGRVFDRVGDTTLAGWARGQGGALRVAWNQATIVVVDFGVSREGAGLYINFGHQF